MSQSYTAVDISQLPYPGIVETPDFETIYNEMREQMSALQPMLFTGEGQAQLHSAELFTDDNGDQYFRVPYAGDDQLLYLDVESDPSARQLQIVAYREMIIRQRVNEACKGVMLAYAKGADLDQLGATFGVVRLLLFAPDEDNNIEPVYEDDSDYRRRIQLSSEGYSSAGPEGAYVFYSLSADPNVKDATAQSPTFVKPFIDQSVKDQLPAGAMVLVVNDDVALTDPMPGDVVITVLSRTGSGVASNELQSKVSDTLSADDMRPITDRVRVRSAEVIEYDIDATVYTYAGPDSELVIKNANDQLQVYVDSNHQLGRDITLSGVYAALHQAGVMKVILNNFEQDIVCDRGQAAYCTGITISHGGVDE